MKKARPTEKERKAREEMEKYLNLKKYTRKSLDEDIARWTANVRFLQEADNPPQR